MVFVHRILKQISELIDVTCLIYPIKYMSFQQGFPPLEHKPFPFQIIQNEQSFGIKKRRTYFCINRKRKV